MQKKSASFVTLILDKDESYSGKHDSCEQGHDTYCSLDDIDYVRQEITDAVSSHNNKQDTDD